MLRQIIRQCSLFDVDISRDLTRPIFNSKTRSLGQKREKKACFSKCFLSNLTPGFDKKSYTIEELLLNKYHTLNISLVL